MNRRGFLKGILAAGIAPAVVGSGILMPVRKIWTPNDLTEASLKQAVNELWDAAALQPKYVYRWVSTKDLYRFAAAGWTVADHERVTILQVNPTKLQLMKMSEEWYNDEPDKLSPGEA